MNSGSELALRHNDASVLENHHASLLWSLLAESRLVAHLRGPQLGTLRWLLLRAVLSTDSAW